MRQTRPWLVVVVVIVFLLFFLCVSFVRVDTAIAEVRMERGLDVDMLRVAK
jgi:hypothetical protein